MTVRRLKWSLGMALAACAVQLVPAHWLARVLCAPLQRWLAALSAGVPFPLAEPLCLCLGLAGAAALARALLRPAGGRLAALGRYASGLAVFLAFLLLSYALLWAPLARAQVPPSPEAGPQRYRALAQSLAAQAQALWTDDFPDAAQTAAQAARLLLEETGRLPTIKAARYPEVLKALNLAGLCFPWTGEAIFRGDLSGLSLPFVAAHEGAHQLGYGSESQASYVAYRACLRQKGAMAYSATAYMLYYALETLGGWDQAAKLEILESLSPKVRADVAAIAASQSTPGPLAGAAQVFAQATGMRDNGYGQVVAYLMADFAAAETG